MTNKKVLPLIVLAGLAAFTVPRSPAEAQADSSLAGIWQGRMNDLPAVDLQLDDVGGKLAGTIVFYFQDRSGPNGHWRASADPPLPVRAPHLIGNTLTFEVEHRKCHACSETDHNVRFRLNITGPDEARLWNLDGENPNSDPGLQLVRQRNSTAASMTQDQTNTALWKNAWTNLVNNVQQTFTPSLPRLTAVEVDLILANPGPPEDTLELTVLDADGNSIAVATKTVPAPDFEHVRFIFPNGGVQVSPGKSYSIRLSGGTLFGWKYVVGGYENGAASFNGKPLLPDARSTFLFRTFGSI
ncbi:MAG TPA: hypothetical protein VLX32_05205 [Candidatus Acidoferrum sp.]|nr:hypothetical protein [Candidatus Acidoferrum sp.]